MADGDVYILGPGNTTSRLYINQLNPVINVHTMIGRHAVKYGLNFIGVQYNNFSPGHSGGNFMFNRSFPQGPDPTVSSPLAGYDFASFLLGMPGTGSVDYNAVPAESIKYYGFYAQDDWKLSHRLTLNLGIRFSHEGPINERFDRGTVGFDPNAPSPIAARVETNYAAHPVPELAQLNVKGGLGFLGVNGTPSGYLAVPAIYY